MSENAFNLRLNERERKIEEKKNVAAIFELVKNSWSSTGAIG